MQVIHKSLEFSRLGVWPLQLQHVAVSGQTEPGVAVVRLTHKSWAGRQIQGLCYNHYNICTHIVYILLHRYMYIITPTYNVQ